VRNAFVSLLFVFLAAPAVAAPEFVRAININGPALVIDGRQWEAGNAPNYENRDRPYENQSVPLIPPTDPARSRMLRAFTYTPQGRNRVALTELKPGEYSVFLYVWEDNNPTVYDVFVNGARVLTGHNSGRGGTWHRLGPWTVKPKNGRIEITSRGGHANWSGIELWRGRMEPGMDAPALTRAQTDFFESKIRPLLVKHCYECHSASAKRVRGGLVLDNRASLRRGGSGGPVIVPGDPESSRMWKAVSYTDPHLKMPPPEKGRLAEHELKALKQWIQMGAPDPRDGEVVLPKKFDLAEARKHWAFRPLAPVNPPPVTDADWPRNDLDRFILRRQEAAGIRPNPDADPETLVRRAYFDLIGLPPTREQLAAWRARFRSDSRERAMAALVDELLASPHYGERWGRHWMDLVRYADTAGDNSDYPIPQLYRYRDYIIRSFNEDKPYDRFIREQIAGDLMPAANQEQRNEQIIATGYLASARRFGSVVDRYPMHLTIEDTIDNLGRTFMGLTLTCARCHDHKFEAISLEDYYGLYGIFASTRYAFPGIELLKVQKDFVPLLPPEELKRIMVPFRAKEKELQSKHDKLLAERNRLEKEKEQVGRKIKGSAGEERKALYKRLNQLEARIVAIRGQIRGAAQAIEKHRQSAPAVPDAYAVQDGEAADARIQLKGDPEHLGAVVPRKFIDLLGGQRLPDQSRKQSGRLQLADWIADPKNPLTARVMVNRVWQHHFGRALAPLPSNFGQRGLPPSHPELLDWLADRFIAGGWSIKQLHRLIMNSRTWQLASTDQSAAAARDPDNQLYWRQNRRRLDAEQLRDSIMFVAGTLDLQPPKGPHPFPPMSKWAFTQHHPFKDSYPTEKRAVYQMTRRLTVDSYWQTFDGPDRNASTPERDESVTTAQSLFLLNDEFVHRQAGRLAERLLAVNEASRVTAAFEMVLSRAPDADERARSEGFVREYRERLRADGCSADELDEQVWSAFARALFKLNGFLYVD